MNANKLARKKKKNHLHPIPPLPPNTIGVYSSWSKTYGLGLSHEHSFNTAYCTREHPIKGKPDEKKSPKLDPANPATHRTAVHGVSMYILNTSSTFLCYQKKRGSSIIVIQTP